MLLPFLHADIDVLVLLFVVLILGVDDHDHECGLFFRSPLASPIGGPRATKPRGAAMVRPAMRLKLPAFTRSPRRPRLRDPMEASTSQGRPRGCP